MEQPLHLPAAAVTAALQGRLDAALADAAAGEAPATAALMRILIEAGSEADARAAFARAIALHEATADNRGAARLSAIQALWGATPNAWPIVQETIHAIAHEHRDETPAGTLRYWAEAFDRLAARSPEASVALYSFGDPGLLAAATDEVVTAMAEWGLLAPERDALDIGCGIGRFLVALAPRLRSLVGLDISGRMVAEATQRCAGLTQVRVAETNGRDLAPINSASMDLVLAADVFPYIVQAGGTLVGDVMAEIARVLRPGGQALILNYSYRGDAAADRRDCRAVANDAGLGVERNGTHDLRLWDAAAFLLRK